MTGILKLSLYRAFVDKPATLSGFAQHEFLKNSRKLEKITNPKDFYKG
jgi:hypothetical protein